MATPTVSKSAALAAARRRWGKSAFVEENRRAPTKEQREANIVRGRELRDRMNKIDQQLNGEKAWQAPLLTAARFVVDVEGQQPSLDQLKAALERAERFQALTDERKELREDQKSLNTAGYRWQAGYVGGVGGLAFLSVHVQADTLEELMSKLSAA